MVSWESHVITDDDIVRAVLVSPEPATISHVPSGFLQVISGKHALALIRALGVVQHVCPHLIRHLGVLNGVPLEESAPGGEERASSTRGQSHLVLRGEERGQLLHAADLAGRGRGVEAPRVGLVEGFYGILVEGCA